MVKMEADQGKQGFAPPAVGVLQQGGSGYPFEKPFLIIRGDGERGFLGFGLGLFAVWRGFRMEPGILFAWFFRPEPREL